MQKAMSDDDIATAEDKRDRESPQAKEVVTVDAETGEIKQPSESQAEQKDEDPFKDI